MKKKVTTVIYGWVFPEYDSMERKFRQDFSKGYAVWVALKKFPEARKVKITIEEVK
jgi:hypothetical protein